MARRPINGLLPQFAKNAGGASASGYWLKLYEPNTTTHTPMYTLQSGGSTLVKCVLNSRGETISNVLDDDSTFIPYVDEDFDAYLFFTAADADANNTTNAIFLGQSIVSEPGGAQFATVAAMISGTALNLPGTFNWSNYVGRTVKTVANNSTSNAGGAEYLITTTNPGNLSSFLDGRWCGRNHSLGGGHYAKLSSSRLTAAMFGMISGISVNNTDAWAKLTQQTVNGDDINFEGGEYRVFSDVPGVLSSSATPATTRAVTASQLPIIQNKQRITLRNGTVYAANQGVSASKRYFPCTLSVVESSDISVLINTEGKGESYGDADASAPLSDELRADFLPYNSGCALLIMLSKDVEAAGIFRLCGSVGVIYVSSSAGVTLNRCFANAASLGYAAYAIDAWVGDTTVSGFRIHDTYLNSCRTHKEVVLSRETGAAVGAAVYASKGGVVIEDPSVKVDVSGGYFADAFPNGGSRDIGCAFYANASTMTVNGVFVDNCAGLGMTGQSVDFPGRLTVSNSEARNLRKTLHQVQATSFGVQEFEYTNVIAEINNTGIWAGDANTARTISSVVANMKVATQVHGKITNCDITGPQCVWVNDAGCYGSLIISNSRIITSGWLCKSGGWGGSSASYASGVIIDGCTIYDDSAETDAYMQYTNNGASIFTYINIDLDSSELTCAQVRQAYSITAAGSNLLLQMNGFPRMIGAWSDSGWLKPSSYMLNYKEQRGLSGSNRRVVFEYPNRVAFKPYVVFDAVTAGENSTHAVLSAVGAAVINADGNVEQEWLINDTGLSLWASDSRIIAQSLSVYPPLA